MYSTHIYLLAVYDICICISHARSKIHTVLNNDMIIATIIIIIVVVFIVVDVDVVVLVVMETN